MRFCPVVQRRGATHRIGHLADSARPATKFRHASRPSRVPTGEQKEPQSDRSGERSVRPGLRPGTFETRVSEAKLMLWKRARADAPVDVVPTATRSVPVSTAPSHPLRDTEQEDAAIDTVVAMLRTPGRLPFGGGEGESGEIRRQFELWATHLAICGPHPDRRSAADADRGRERSRGGRVGTSPPAASMNRARAIRVTPPGAAPPGPGRAPPAATPGRRSRRAVADPGSRRARRR
jgi:hypothetical protein